jgi:hypothetical protein
MAETLWSDGKIENEEAYFLCKLAELISLTLCNGKH